MATQTAISRTIILCGGEGERWNGHLGLPKHFVPIDGKPLLRLTIDRLAAAGCCDIVIAGRGDGYTIDGTSFLHVDAAGCTLPASKFTSTRAAWNEAGPTLLLFGDVHLSDSALDAALSNRIGHIHFVGRIGASRITGCAAGEIFAIAFDAAAHPLLDQALAAIARTNDGRAAGWQLYDLIADRAALQSLPGRLSLSFSHVDDMSEDFDYPQDYEKWLAARSNPVIQRHDRERQLRRKWQRRVWKGLAGGAFAGALVAYVALPLFGAW